MFHFLGTRQLRHFLGGGTPVVARYWRLNHFSTGGRAAATECHFLDGNGAKLPGTVSSSSVRYSNTAANAYDDDTGTYWQAATGDNTDAWFAIDLGAGNDARVESIYFDPADNTTAMADGFTELEYSEDGSTWVSLGTISHSYDWSVDPNGTIDVSGLTLISDVESMFASGESGVILDPSDFSTMWQDTGKTTPVTGVGDPVRVIADRRGSGIEFTANSDAERPTLQQDTGGVYYLDFTGGQGMEYYDTGLDFPTPTLLANVRSNSTFDTIAGRSYREVHNSPYFLWNFFTVGSNNWESRLNGTPITAASGMLPGDEFRSIVVDPSGGKFYSTDNLGALTEDSFSPVSPINYTYTGKVLLGMSAGGGEKWTGRLYGCVVVDRSVTTDDVSSMANWQVGD